MFETATRRIITIGHGSRVAPPPPPSRSVTVSESCDLSEKEAEKTEGVAEVYLRRFGSWCRDQGLQDWALVATAILARVISATLTIRLAIEMGRGQSVLISVLFGVLLELASCTFAWFAIVHPHDGIRLAARCTTAALIIGSMTASVSWLSKSMELQNNHAVTSSVEFQLSETTRQMRENRVQSLSKIIEGDAEKYRKRALDTDEKVGAIISEIEQLGRDQTKMMRENKKTTSHLLFPFILCACILEVIAILALALWRFRTNDYEEE